MFDNIGDIIDARPPMGRPCTRTKAALEAELKVKAKRGVSCASCGGRVEDEALDNKSAGLVLLRGDMKWAQFCIRGGLGRTDSYEQRGGWRHIRAAAHAGGEGGPDGYYSANGRIVFHWDNANAENGAAAICRECHSKIVAAFGKFFKDRSEYIEPEDRDPNCPHPDPAEGLGAKIADIMGMKVIGNKFSDIPGWNKDK